MAIAWLLERQGVPHVILGGKIMLDFIRSAEDE
jgi:hypothetical protein